MFSVQHGMGPPMAKESLWALTFIIVAAHVFALSGLC
jgi:hypothetical protein